MPTARITESSLKRLFEGLNQAGFPLVGAVDIALARADFTVHADRYAEWITSGFHGEMTYLVRGLDRRKNPELVLPGAKSVVTVAIPYRRTPANGGTPGTPQYARYLEGPDYHKYLPALIEPVMEEWTAGSDIRWKVCVDTSAVLERTWAALSGLGWIGKNTLLIHPKLGSYLFIATILLDHETGVAPTLLPNYCGNCSNCLQSCPTEAFVKPGTVDSRKCISYLTLEKRGEWSTDEKSISNKIGTWVAGCDICQEVCPFNRKPEKLAETWPADIRDSALVRDWTILESETEEQYKQRVQFSALSRIKYPEMTRNLSAARVNAGIKKIKE